MATYNADVIVYGNTMAGLLAAKAATMNGRTVVITAENTYAGGMTRGGLCNMDIGPSGAKSSYLGGLTKSQFLAYLDTQYGKPAGTLTTTPEPRMVSDFVSSLLSGMAPNVTNVAGKTLSMVKKSGATITSIVAGGDTYSGTVFIDASYEGELMKQAGVTTSWGREAQATYGESNSLATGFGVVGFGSNLQPQGINVLDANGQRLYGSGPIPRNDIVAGDAYASLSGFNFRPCLTSTPAKKRAIAQPVGYKASDYQILLNFLAVHPEIIKLVGVPSGTDCVFGGRTLTTNDGAIKYDCNYAGLVSSNLLNAAFGKANISWAYANANRATRNAIATEHYRWTCGLLYFIQNDASLNGTALQTDANNYAFCNDEFVSNFLGQAGFPSELYVRECRRLVGQYVMTVDDVRPGATKPDVICRFNYSVDHHSHQRYPRRTNVAQWENEGGYNQLSPTGTYDIPWRALLPVEGQADNLIVPVCISASHIAWGALRLELQQMMQGEAAGLAAHLALADGVDVVRLPYARLRPALLAQGALI